MQKASARIHTKHYNIKSLVVNYFFKKFYQKSKHHIHVLISKISTATVGPIYALCTLGVNQLENIWKKIFPESSRKQNLNLPGIGNYLHSTVLDVMSNLEMI